MAGGAMSAASQHCCNTNRFSRYRHLDGVNTGSDVADRAAGKPWPSPIAADSSARDRTTDHLWTRDLTGVRPTLALTAQTDVWNTIAVSAPVLHPPNAVHPSVKQLRGSPVVSPHHPHTPGGCTSAWWGLCKVPCEGL